MSEISLFSGYSKSENLVTNYCLLLLKLLYEESPRLLGETLTALVGESVSGLVGVTFLQQEKKGAGIPDGLIVQQAFHIHIETKTFDWFYDGQLERHLEDLSKEAGTRVLVALSNFETRDAERFATIKALCETKYSGKIYFAQVTFEDFVGALPTAGVSKRLLDSFAEFAQFLDGKALLPRWKTLLDVINCSGWPDEVAKHRVYICPAAGGAYNHSRAKYFGAYANKAVELVSVIEGVVELGDDGEAKLKWNNGYGCDADLTRRAVDMRTKLRPTYEGPLRVFLLGELHQTDFKKISSGGMQQSKRYFETTRFGEVRDAAGLATALRGKTWE